MAKCSLHPGRESVATLYGRTYCAQCQSGIQAARGRVGGHVQPKECFLWYASNDNWQPIDGTGCAHWVAHQLNIKTGGDGSRCLDGFPYRVRALVSSRAPVPDLAHVRPNDIWASPSLDHTGLVLNVTPATTPGGKPTIVIRHDSSRQGGVYDNDFATYFHGRGNFYR